MVVPRGLGLVAALAVSGTALYFVYGYNKKKAFVNIRKGKGSLRLEYHHPNALQQQQQQSPLLTKDSGGVCLELREGKHIGIVEFYWHHLPRLRRVIRRQPEEQKPLLLLAAEAPPPSESRQREDSLKEKLLKCEADAAVVKALHSSLSSYMLGDQQQLGDSLRINSGSEALTGEAPEAQSFEVLETLDNGLAKSSSSSSSCIRSLPERHARDSLLLLPSSSSSSSAGDDCGSKAILSTASSSTSSSSSSSRSYAVVGCFISSGSKKTTGKQKKVVRFSPSVAEPSSNNHDYRRRFKAQIAQRAALSVHQTQGQPSEAATRSIAYDRPRLLSQAAKQTITYNIHRADQRYIHRTDHRYGGRSYLLGHSDRGFCR